MRYYLVLILLSLSGFLIVSCNTSTTSADEDSTKINSDTLHEISIVNCPYKITQQDSVNMISVFTLNFPVSLFKRADTTSELLNELQFRSRCMVFKSDVLEMKPIIRCVHDSCIGYVRSKDLFQTLSSPTNPYKQYLIWLSSEDSIKVGRLDTKIHKIEEEISLGNSGVYIYTSLMNTQTWTSTAAAIKIEMNPAACDETIFKHVVDYNNKLKLLTVTSSYGEEGSSSGAYVVFKKDRILNIVNTETWQDLEDKNDPVHEKTEISEYEWNGDSLEFIGKNIISGN